MPPLIFAYRHFLSLRNLFFVYVTGGFLLLGIFCFAIFTKLRTTTCVYLSTVCSQNHVFFPSWRVAFFRRSDSAAQFFLLPPHSLNACNRLVDRSSRWYLTWSPEPVISPTDQYCWFARDVTAAMLAVKNKSISLLWELNSIFILFLGEKITLFWLPTWHVPANQEYKWRL